MDDFRTDLHSVFDNINSCSGVVRALEDLGITQATMFNVAEEAASEAMNERWNDNNRPEEGEQGVIPKLPVPSARPEEDMIALFTVVEEMVLERLNQCACKDGKEAFHKDILGLP